MSMMPLTPQAAETGDVPMTPVILPMEFGRSLAGNAPLDCRGRDRRPALWVQEFAFPAIAAENDKSPAHGTPGAIWPVCDCTEMVEAGANLAEKIARRLSLGSPSVLALTSPGDGDGKTSVLTVLAPELARRTPGGALAVDADFRNADLTGLLTLAASRTPGGSPLIYPTNLAGLNVLPMPPGLQSHYLDAAWVEEVRESWPLTILDMASLEHAETVSLLRHCDGVCLVVRLGHTARRTVAEAVRVIRANGGRLLGTVVVGDV